MQTGTKKKKIVWLNKFEEQDYASLTFFFFFWLELDSFTYMLICNMTLHKREDLTCHFQDIFCPECFYRQTWVIPGTC